MLSICCELCTDCFVVVGECMSVFAVCIGGCIVFHLVRLYRFVDIVVKFGDVIYYSCCVWRFWLVCLY